MAEVEPDRSILADVEGGEPELTNTIEDAPYGYKKDGTPAKRRGRPAGPNSGTRRTGGRRSTGSLRTQIGSLLVTINLPIQLLSAKNALDRVEIDALAKSIDEECQRDARFRKYVEQMLAVQGGTSIVLVVGAIAGRRVARNNLISVPEPIGNQGLDDMLGGVISMTTGSGIINPNLAQMAKQDA